MKAKKYFSGIFVILVVVCYSITMYDSSRHPAVQDSRVFLKEDILRNDPIQDQDESVFNLYQVGVVFKRIVDVITFFNK